MRTEYRIELEENIMDCWRVVDDIRVVQTMHQDMGELSVDDMSIILMGIQKLYSLKFQLLFEVFEKHLKALHDNKTAKDEERDSFMQIITDPENQPSQYGTVTFEYMDKEIAKEREACVEICKRLSKGRGCFVEEVLNEAVEAIRARGVK